MLSSRASLSSSSQPTKNLGAPRRLSPGLLGSDITVPRGVPQRPTAPSYTNTPLLRVGGREAWGKREVGLESTQRWGGGGVLVRAGRFWGAGGCRRLSRMSSVLCCTTASIWWSKLTPCLTVVLSQQSYFIQLQTYQSFWKWSTNNLQTRQQEKKGINHSIQSIQVSLYSFLRF